MKIRISFDIEGELARAFTAERRKTLATKAVLGREALVEYLNERGHDVQDSTAPWGGHREQDEDEKVPEIEAVA